MRVTDLLITIGAALGFASADVVYNTEALHHAAQVIADTVNEGFKKSVKDLYSSRNVKDIAKDQFGSIILGLNRTYIDCNSNDCAQQFDSIIKECVTGQELGGGIAITNGMAVEVSIDTSLSEASKTKTKAKTRTKPKKTKSKVKRAKKTKPKKTKSKTKPKAKPEPKKTKTKPKKAKSKACPINNKKTPGKKGSKHGLRSLIPTLFPRAGSQQSSSEECEAFDEDMHIPAGWGETYFGFTEEIYGTMDKKKLLSSPEKPRTRPIRRNPHAYCWLLPSMSLSTESTSGLSPIKAAKKSSRQNVQVSKRCGLIYWSCEY